MSDRKDSFRHLIDAIKREPIKSQGYINDYCEHENASCVIFAQKHGTFTLLWKSTVLEQCLQKKIATVLPDVQYIVVADDSELKSLGSAKLTLDMFNKEHPENVVTVQPVNHESAIDEDADCDDDDCDDTCQGCEIYDECDSPEKAVKHMRFEVPIPSPLREAHISREQFIELATLVVKVAKKLKKLNRKVNEM